MSFVSYAQNFEDVMLWRALGNVRRGFYIDLGASDPEADSVTAAFYQRGWRGVNVEPLAEDCEKLRAARPEDVTLQVAVGAASGAQTLHVFPAARGLSTLSAAQADATRSRQSPTLREVEVTTLADICRRHAPEAIHFLKIDVEGAEREVLEGADFARFRPWIVLLEATLPNTRIESHAEWEPLLLQADYRFVWFDGLNRFYVADEHHAALARHFVLPPNLFDDFTRRSAVAPAAQPAPTVVAALAAPTMDEEGRIAMTMRCRDADPVPKVADAGQVVTAPDGSRTQIMHNGLKVVADGYYGAWMTRLIENCRGHHEPQEERLFHEVVSRLPPGGTMIELGGYWAYYSLWFLHAGAGRRAIVVEPDPAHLDVGRRNAALNGLDAAFVTAFTGPAAPQPALFTTETSGEQILPSVTVPELMAARGLDRIEILHCDTQGAELAVLTECTDLLREGRIRWLFVSTHAWQISGDPLTHHKCLALLREAGATIVADHDVHESFSGDGLIVACCGPLPDDWVPVALSRNRASESLFRDLAYDLVAARSNLHDTLAHAMVDALFETLLLRPPDPGGLAVFARHLVATNDLKGIVQGMLRSPEFAALKDAFLELYVAPATAAAQDGS